MSETNATILKIVLFSSILIAIFVGYFIWSFVKQQRRVLRWQKARIKAEIEMLENERKRIATDLHDEIGPMLSAVKLQINHFEPIEESELAALEKSSTQIDHIIQRFRDISYNLLPNTLVRKGLVRASEEFVNKMQEVTPLKIK